MVISIWLIALAWLILVCVLHIKGQAVKKLALFDYWMRIIFVLGMSYAFLYIVINQPEYIWAGKKILAFTLTVICGLIIRKKLRSFEPAFVSLIEGKDTAESNQMLKMSIASSRPFVILIWVCLLFNTVLGLHLI